MEEDIIFGKNRHLYGGLEPSNMTAFTTNLKDGKLYLQCMLPKDTVIDGQTLVTVAGAVIRKSTSNFPKDEFDGELFMDISADGLYIDESNTMDGVCYYAAFPYSDQGVYNRSELNRLKYDPYEYVFGYDLDTTDPNPDTCVTYPADVNNYGWAAAHMDYDTDAFDYGDWVMNPGQYFMPKPCMIGLDGTVDHYLDPNDYSLQEDGVTPSKISDESFVGNAMMEWPKIYTKRWEENGIYHFRCSNVKQDADWDCWCNYDANDDEIERFYTSIYTNTIDYPKRAKSMSGTIATNDDNYTISSIRSYSMDNGDGWDMETVADRFLIQDLLVMMAKSTDGQKVYGDGNTGGTDDKAVVNGTMDKKGMFWGTYDSSMSRGTNGVKVFGMENWWGNVSRAVVGLIYNVVDGTYHVKLTHGKHDGTSVIGYSLSKTEGYISIPGPTVTSNTSWYIGSMTTLPYGRLPSGSSGGSSTTYLCDAAGYKYDKWADGTRIAIACVGGDYDDSPGNQGPFRFEFNVKSSNDSDTHSSSLSFKPLKS